MDKAANLSALRGAEARGRPPRPLDAPEMPNPFESMGSFLVLMGVAYRLLFSGMASGFLDNGLAALLVFSGLALCLVSMVRSDAEPLRLNLAAGSLVLFVVTMLLAGRASGYFRAAVGPITDVAALAAVFVAVSGKMFRRSDAAFAAAFLTALVGIVVAVGFYQRFLVFPMLAEKLPTLKLPGWVDGIYIDEKSVADFKTRVKSAEVFSTFYTSNVLAGFLALALPTTLGLAAGVVACAARPARKIAAATLLIVLAAGEAWLVVLTKSKAGLAAAAVALLVLALMLVWRLRRRWVFAAVVAAILVAIAAGAFFGAPRAKQFYYEAKTSLDLRAGYWRATWRLIREDPLMGVGPGNFAQNYFAYKAIGEGEVKNPHNAYLLIWAEGGAFSLLFFAAFWLLAFAGPRGREGPPRPPGRYLAAFAIIAAAATYSTLSPSTVFAESCPLAVPLFAGAIVAAGAVILLWPALAQADGGFARAGMAAGLAGFLLACAVDVTFSDAGAATAAIFAAAALSPRGRTAALQPRTMSAYGLAAAGVVGVVAFVAFVLAPMGRAETAMEESTYYLTTDDFPAAADAARTAILSDPSDPAPYVRIGLIYERTGGTQAGNFALAERAYLKAVELDSRCLPAHERLARLYAAMGPPYYQKASSECKILLALYPMNSQYRIAAGRLCEKGGKRSEALKHYKLAIDIDAHTHEHGMQLSPAERESVIAAISRLDAQQAK